MNALSVELYRHVWTFLIQFDNPRSYKDPEESREDGAIIDLETISSFMAANKKAKNVVQSLNGWTICSLALS
jgi:hypothetical protein